MIVFLAAVSWIVVFLFGAAIAGALGFGGIAQLLFGIASTVFSYSLVVFVFLQLLQCVFLVLPNRQRSH